ncbi:MAG: redoxin domain-containing protein [Bacteroidales bacterium]|nr:redoxin domain-containing protein [Bacteroidales bacterium]
MRRLTLLNIVFSVIVLVFLTQCDSKKEKGNSEVRLKIKNATGQPIYFQRIGVENLIPLDTQQVNKEGEVYFTTNIDDFEFFFVSLTPGQKIILLLEKGEKAIVYTDISGFSNSYEVLGSPGSRLLMNIVQHKQKTLRIIDSLGTIWSKAKESDSAVSVKARLDSCSYAAIAAHKEYIKTFIENNSHSPASIIAAYQYLLPEQPVLTIEEDTRYFKIIAETLAEAYPKNQHVIDFKVRTTDFIKSRVEARKAEETLNTGKKAPPIIHYSTKAKRIGLEEYLGKYVLIYFWDARSQRCWDINQELKKLYKAYNYHGFDIYGVYTGENKELLFQAIEADDIPWNNVFGTTETMKKYNVPPNSPRLIMLDKEGVIIKKDITVDALKNMLKWTLKPGIPPINTDNDSISGNDDK